jgi:hypothetical protein
MSDDLVERLRNLDLIDDYARLEAADRIEELTKALEKAEAALIYIRGAHTPDQPADSSVDEISWVMRHVGDLRRVAANALKERK